MCESDGRGDRVVGDGMVAKAEYVKQGDLPEMRDGVHVPWTEEPLRQESEGPYER